MGVVCAINRCSCIHQTLVPLVAMLQRKDRISTRRAVYQNKSDVSNRGRGENPCTVHVPIVPSEYNYSVQTVVTLRDGA